MMGCEFLIRHFFQQKSTKLFLVSHENLYCGHFVGTVLIRSTSAYGFVQK